MGYKALTLGLTLLWSLCLTCGAAAYAPDDYVGQPGMLLAGMSGNGSLTDESVLGDACADAVRTAANADFAIVPGGAFRANLEPKPSTYADIAAVLTEPEQPVAVAALTAAELAAMLEAGVSHITLDGQEAIDRGASSFEGFPQVSGFSFTYDASAHPGERVMRIRTENGELDLNDPSAVYTVAAPARLFAGAYGYPACDAEETGVTLAEALAAFVAAGTGDAYTGEGRITAVGCTDYNIVNHFPLTLCVAAAIVIWVGARLWKFKYSDRNTR